MDCGIFSGTTDRCVFNKLNVWREGRAARNEGGRTGERSCSRLKQTCQEKDKYCMMCVHVFSCVRFFVTPWPVACQAPLCMGFSGQEYWSRQPFPSPGDLPDLGIKPTSPVLAVLCLFTQLCPTPYDLYHCTTSSYTV